MVMQDTEASHGILFPTEADRAREEFRQRMEAIGAKVECDDLACMYATIEGSDPNAKGSCWDHTVIQ